MAGSLCATFALLPIRSQDFSFKHARVHGPCPGYSSRRQLICASSTPRRALALARSEHSLPAKEHVPQAHVEDAESSDILALGNNDLHPPTGAAEGTTTSTPAKQTVLLSTTLPLLVLANIPWLRSVLQPGADLFSLAPLPPVLIHWAHGGVMGIILAGMGGYGSYLGWQIRGGAGGDEVALQKAKQQHPQMLRFAALSFAFGAVGGLTALVQQGQPVFESPHAITGMVGLVLLGTQYTLTRFFKENPELRTVHAFLGTATMALLVGHAVLGVKLGLSF